MEIWEIAGIPEANALLLELGFDTPTINLVDLSNAFSSELKNFHSDRNSKEYLRLLKGALTLYQEEARNLK